MLPVLNRPIIDYIVQDCIAAGITDIYFVTSPGSAQIRDYYTDKPELVDYLRQNGKEAYIAEVTPPKDVRFHFIEQDTSPTALYGTTIPVWLCREYIEPNEHVLVLTGDDFMHNPDGSSDIARLIEVVKDGGSAMLGVEVPHDTVSRYGVLATHADDAGRLQFEYIQEKPSVSEAKSNLINVSKYIFDASIFTYLDNAVQNGVQHNGEYYITDPINEYVQAGNAIQVVQSRGTYLDVGTVENWLAANNYMADVALPE